MIITCLAHQERNGREKFRFGDLRFYKYWEKYGFFIGRVRSGVAEYFFFKYSLQI